METQRTMQPGVGVSVPQLVRRRPLIGGDGWRPGRVDWIVAAFVVLLGVGEAISSGLGWPWLRIVAALAIAGLLLARRRAPLHVLVAVAVINLVVNIALRIGGHYLLVSGLMLAVGVHALVRWSPVRQLAVGLGVVAGHALIGSLVNPNWSAVGAALFYGTPILLAAAARPWNDRRAGLAAPIVPPDRRHGNGRSARVAVAGLAVAGVFAVSGGGFAVDQFHSYITRTRSPTPPAGWAVDAATLRRAAEASRGTHGPDGAIIHTVDYPYQLLAALERPTFSVEADVTVIDGEGFLQHDPRDPVGMPLLEFLEYAAIAEFPIVKLDLKCDRVGPIIAEVRTAIDEFGLDPAHVHFNADVFRGPGVDENVFGARTDLSITDAMYNLIVMELETSDLVRVAQEFPAATIVISATTPKGASDAEYSERHLLHFMEAVADVRAASPAQSLVFAVRGDLAARSDPSFLAGLDAVADSYVAAWWAEDVPATAAEIDTLRSRGVTFLDLGEEDAA